MLTVSESEEEMQRPEDTVIAEDAVESFDSLGAVGYVSSDLQRDDEEGSIADPIPLTREDIKLALGAMRAAAYAVPHGDVDDADAEDSDPPVPHVPAAAAPVVPSPAAVGRSYLAALLGIRS